MNKHLDASGQACPLPVMMAKKEIDAGTTDFTITVDNDMAVENLKKLANSQNFLATVILEEEAHFILEFHLEASGEKPQSSQAPAPENSSTDPTTPGSWSIFMGKDIIGTGDYELGRSLARMYFYTISQAEDIPQSILFMNNGVKLPTLDDQVVTHLKVLAERGVEILVCGTCLDYYRLKDQLKIGELSNMYDITERMAAATKVITL